MKKSSNKASGSSYGRRKMEELEKLLKVYGEKKYIEGFEAAVLWIEENLYKPNMSRTMVCDEAFFDRLTKEKLNALRMGEIKT